MPAYKKRGYKSVLANHAFVFHLEARSFTLEAKKKLLEENSKILYKRYPTYRESVRKYMKEALVREGQAEETAGVKMRTGFKSRLKNAVKHSSKTERLARKVHSTIKR